MASTPMDSPIEQHYSLKWNDYSVKIVTAFQSLRDEEDFVDVTVACDGHQYSAHKMVLSACSPYFRAMLRANPCQHPIVILKDVGHAELERLLEFMYNGEVNIAQDQLAAFLRTAENLKIRGLAGSSDEMEQACNRDFLSLDKHHNQVNNLNAPTTGNINSAIPKEEDERLGVLSTVAEAEEDDVGCGGGGGAGAGVGAGAGGRGGGAGSGGGGGGVGDFSPAAKRRKVVLLDPTEQDGGLVDDCSAVDDGGGGALLTAQATTPLGVDVKCIARDLKSEPCDVAVSGNGALTSIASDVYSGEGVDGNTTNTSEHAITAPHMYTIGVGGGSSSGGVAGGNNGLSAAAAAAGHHDLSVSHAADQGDVSALMAIANAVQATAPSERPIKCPLCQNIIKHARNLRRHVFKRHLPAAERGEITESDVKNVLERKLKAITVTPLTDDEMREVQQRIRRRGFKAPRKKKGLTALPSELNAANIDENEVTIRKIPVKKERKVETHALIPGAIIPVINSTAALPDLPRVDTTPREDILQEALAARDKEPQEEVMDLAISQQHQLPPISVVVSQTIPQTIQVSTQPMSVTVTQTAGGVHARIPTEAALQAGVRFQTESPIPLQRDLMPTMTFEPQVAISETLTATYHNTTSPSQALPQTSSPISSSAGGYVPGCYWSAPSVTGLAGATFQPHQPVFGPTHTEYFTTGVHMTGRPATIERMPQHRRKPYQ